MEEIIKERRTYFKMSEEEPNNMSFATTYIIEVSVFQREGENTIERGKKNLFQWWAGK